MNGQTSDRIGAKQREVSGGYSRPDIYEAIQKFALNRKMEYSHLQENTLFSASSPSVLCLVQIQGFVHTSAEKNPVVKWQSERKSGKFWNLNKIGMRASRIKGVEHLAKKWVDKEEEENRLSSAMIISQEPSDPEKRINKSAQVLNNLMSNWVSTSFFLPLVSAGRLQKLNWKVLSGAEDTPTTK